MSDVEVVQTSNKLTFATAIVCSLLFILSIGAVAYSFYQREGSQRDVNRAVCVAVIRLDGAITDSLKRSLADIPKLAYYKDHPDERDQQLREVRQSLKKFIPPPECGTKGVKP